MHDVDDNEIEASYPDKFACADCFDDDHVKAFIEDNATRRRCTYCGKRSRRKNIAAPVDDVIQRLFDAISRRYGDAWASGSSWDSEDQQYLNETWDTEDIVSRFVDLPQDDSTELYQDIVNAFPTRDWSSVDPWSSTYAEILEWGWKRFVNAVKHQRRFFFTRKDEEEDDVLRDPESLDPGQLLDRFGKGCAESGLIKTISVGTTILRCRPRSRRSERFAKARELGPPPPQFARQNRMSPAGIPMFYGSDNKKTTLSEMPELPKHYAIGEFETLRRLRLLDLTNVKYPSIFDMSEDADYDWLIFMSQFLADFSSPIARDDRIHIDYVPTQVVTEYLRDAKLGGEPPVEGIKYRSARRKGGVCYVLFINEYGVEPNVGDLTGNDEEDERVWRKPKNGYTLKLRQITHHTGRT